jgi:hypothetical protein
MYSVFQHTGTLSAWKALYCTSRYEGCARYERLTLGHPVPVNLMPNGALLKATKK